MATLFWAKCLIPLRIPKMGKILGVGVGEALLKFECYRKAFHIMKRTLR